MASFPFFFGGGIKLNKPQKLYSDSPAPTCQTKKNINVVCNFNRIAMTHRKVYFLTGHNWHTFVYNENLRGQMARSPYSEVNFV